MAKVTRKLPRRKVKPAPADRAVPMRNLLGLQGVDREVLMQLLTRARGFSLDTRPIGAPWSDALKGRTVANLFFEDSTRTRTSFSMAAARLGAAVLEFGATTSSVSKGETLIDTALNVQAMGVDALVVRAKQSGAAAMISKAVQCAVINAGDGRHEHPTQGLLDIFTLADSFGRDDFDLSGLAIAIVGDCVSSRVARSAIAGMCTLGAKVICIGPPSMAPRSMESLGCKVESHLDDVVPKADAIMMLRVQFERHGDAVPGEKTVEKKISPIPSSREYRDGFALTPQRAANMKPKAIIMHPGPMNRGLEIDAEVADGPRSVILKQAADGVFCRMAALEWCIQASN